MKTRMLLLPLLFLAGCASGPTTTAFKADRVVGRSDGASGRPDWASETVSVVDKGDKLNVVGVLEVPGDSRAQAAFKGSDAAARGHLANKIETQLTKIVESSEGGFSMEDQQLRAVIREVSRSTFHGIDVKERYWEKVVRTKSDGQEELVLKAFTLLTVPSNDVKNMIAGAVKKANAAPTSDRTALEKLVTARFLASDLAVE